MDPTEDKEPVEENIDMNNPIIAKYFPINRFFYFLDMTQHENRKSLKK